MPSSWSCRLPFAPVLAFGSVDPGILLHPRIVLRREQENQAAIGDLRDEAAGPLLLHGRAALAAAGAFRRDVRSAMDDDATVARLAVEAIGQPRQPQSDRGVAPAGTLAAE